MEFVRINLRGAVFKTRYTIFQKIIESMTTEHESDRTYSEDEKEYFFDRDPRMFNSVLDYHIFGSFHLPPDMCAVQSRQELLFWGIDESQVQKCCLKYLYDDDLDTYKHLEAINTWKRKKVPCKIGPKQKACTEDAWMIFDYRKRIWSICDNPEKSFAGKMWVAFIMLNTIISVVVYGLNTTLQFRSPRDPETIPNITLDSDKMMMFLHTENSLACEVLDIASNGILFIDLVIRIIVCPNKRHFLISFGTVCELIAIVTVIFNLVADRNPQIHSNAAVSSIFLFIGVLYSTRVIRVLRVVGLFKEVKILYLCICLSFKVLLLLIVTFLSFALIFGAAMFWAEFQYSDMFYNYFISVWWAIVTMTTVGYGEYYPTTLPGYIVGVVTALFGLMILAIPVAILSSTFNTYYSCHKYQERHNETDRCDTIAKPKEIIS